MAATINWITYVGGQWWGFACTADREQTRRFLLCLFCIDSLSEADLDRIMSTTEHNLLKSIIAFDHHILRPILLDSPISRVDLISTGSLFQAFGAATANALSEDTNLVHGTSTSCLLVLY